MKSVRGCAAGNLLPLARSGGSFPGSPRTDLCQFGSYVAQCPLFNLAKEVLWTGEAEMAELTSAVRLAAKRATALSVVLATRWGGVQPSATGDASGRGEYYCG